MLAMNANRKGVEKDPTRGLNAAVLRVLDAARAKATPRLTYDDLVKGSGLSKSTVILKVANKERHLTLRELELLAPVVGMTPLDVLQEAERDMLRQEREDRRNPLAGRIRGHLEGPAQKFEETSSEPVTEGKEIG